MGKSKKPTKSVVEKEKMCAYEVDRMKRIQSNAAVLEAKGLSKFANKVLQQKYDRVTRSVAHAASLSKEDMTSQHEPAIDSQVKHAQATSLNESDLTLKIIDTSRGKKQLIQTVPMADFLRLKSQEKHQRKMTSPQQPVLIQESNSDVSVGQHGPPQNQEQVEVEHLAQPQETQQKKILSQEQGKRKIQYCVPGSMSKYLAMRKMQCLRTQQSNDMNRNHGSYDSPLVDEDLREEHATNGTDVDESDFSGDDRSSHNEDLNVAEELPENGNAVTQEKRRRGRTILTQVHARTMDNRDVIILNHLHQPVGPSKEIVDTFSRFLGTLAKDSTYAPLNFISWKYVPTKDKIWEYVQKKYIVPEEGKSWVLSNINSKWRLHKARVKQNYYSKYETMEERLSHRPEHIPEAEFEDLLSFWDSEEAKKISDTNKGNRENQSDMHTMGPSSYALLRHTMQQKDPNKRIPSQAELYIESRKRIPGRIYRTRNEETLENIEKMKALKSMDNGSEEIDPYHKVITKKEHPGRLRMYGLGVTKSSLKMKDDKAPFVLPPVFVESITQELQKTLTAQMDQRFFDLISKMREANPGVDLVIPDFSIDEEDELSSHENLNGDPAANS